MWILPKQLHTSVSALDTKGLEQDLELFCQICEKSLWWRGKHTSLRTWLQRWKKVSWIKHLSTRMLKPSHTKSLEDALILCHSDFLASRLVLLEKEIARVMKDISSRTSQKESNNVNPGLFSEKMWQELSQPKQPTENRFSNMSSEQWNSWVTEQRQEYSQRKSAVLRTNESECSSLGWPTARTSDAEGGRIETIMTKSGFQSKRHKSKQTFGAKLRDAVETYEQNWATPQVTDATRAGTIRSPEELKKARSASHMKSQGKQRGGCRNLREDVLQPQNWPTPTKRDYKGSYKPESLVRRDGKSRMDALPQVVEYDKTTVTQVDQANPSMTGKPHELNPDWVEQLMGIPVGWTDLGSWGTE